MPSRSSNSSKILVALGIILLLSITQRSTCTVSSNASENRFYAIGFWYSSTNINNQTLGVSGRITVYDNKIKGTGLRVYEFVQILFSDGSWIQIGYVKYLSGQLEYYWEYLFAAAPPPSFYPIGPAKAGETPLFKIYRSDTTTWKLLKDGSQWKITAPSGYSRGRAEAALESVDSAKKTMNDGRGRFTELKYYYGGSWSNWNAIKFTNGSGKAGVEYPPDPPYHAKASDTNGFITWGDYDADP